MLLRRNALIILKGDMINKVSESISNGSSVVIPMADVQHVEKVFRDRNMANGKKKGDLRKQINIMGYFMVIILSLVVVKDGYFCYQIMRDLIQKKRHVILLSRSLKLVALRGWKYE